MIVAIGLDLAEIERFEFDDVRAKWFERRIFTDVESAYAERKRRPAPHLAGAFAAKEAFRKALGHAVPWREVGVEHDASGAPIFRLTGAAANAFAARGVTRIHLTITHTDRTAGAMVIFEA